MNIELYLSYIRNNIDKDGASNGSLGTPVLDFTLVEYFKEKNMEDLMNDVFKDVTLFNKKSVNNAGDFSPLAKSFVEFIRTQLVGDLDTVGLKYFLQDVAEKQGFLKRYFPKKGLLYETMRGLLATISYESLQNGLQDLITLVEPNIENVRILSARECSTDIKKEIRSEFKDSHVMFKVDTSLLGGMLLHINGKIVDNSYLGKLSLLK